VQWPGTIAVAKRLGLRRQSAAATALSSARDTKQMNARLARTKAVSRLFPTALTK